MTMTKDTFREALSITLRITWIAGCTPSSPPVTVAAPTNLDLGDADGGLAPAVSSKPDPAPKPVFASCGHDTECCSAYIKGLDAGAWPRTQETADCCDAVLTRAEKSRDFSGEIWRCCDEPGLRTSHQRFCSPWGPPMPPTIVWLDDTLTCQSFEWRERQCADTIHA